MTALTARQHPYRRWWIWLLLFILIFFIGVTILGMFVFSSQWMNASTFLPAALRSGLMANYSADLQAYSFQALQIGLVEEAIRDRERLGEPAGGNMLPTLAIFLQTPVPTITPTAFISQNPTSAVSFTPTPTLFSLEATPTGISAHTPTLTLVFSPTSTLVWSATPTRTPSSTLPVSSPTRTPGLTASPLPPTATRVPPTASPVPTRTLPPPPTPTPYEPPVDTPPPPSTPYP